METTPSSSSSSSSSPPAKRFDLFLSFRGEDTRPNFMSHLSRALQKIGLFNIFKDDYALEKGKDIWPELKNSIKDSQCAVVVLSENYATSSWCLRELAKIVKCAGNESLKIRTIFYHVNPSDVRNVKSTDERKQKGSFWKAMEAHKQNPSNSEKTLEKWRNALVTVANQSGYPVEDHTDEASFIEEFVSEISSELGASIRTTDGLFGMTSRLEELDSYVLQSSATNNVCFIGIHGMGGIGKSTLAGAYYKKMSHKFEGHSFLENVREVSESNVNGLVHMQNRLLKDILENNFDEIGCLRDGIDMIRSRLRHKKVLIVLDDVSTEEQLNALADEAQWFGSGSIIIVTTREDSFLKIRKFAMYSVECLNPCQALQLFSFKAFRRIEPPEEFKELSEEVVKYAGNLPLALTVMGPLFGCKEKVLWKDVLCRLRECPDNDIVKKLKISFDDLDEADQRIFLDITCFFKGYDKSTAIEILESCGFHSNYGISNLIDKSLVSIQEGRIWVHDLLEEMGKQLGRQSRIWDRNDLYQTLKNEEGRNEVEAIEAIATSLDETEEYSFEALSYMKKLRLLQITGGQQIAWDGIEVSNNLQYLEWNAFPCNKFPSSFHSCKLVQLKLCQSAIEQLWNKGIKPLYSLKVIDLSRSHCFTKFEDFSVVPNLETLNLYGCTKLSEIHCSIKHLKKLIRLNLGYCTSLETLPDEINGLISLQVLKLIGCYKLKKLPDNLEQLNSLRNLEIQCSGVKHLPSSIFFLENLESVDCDNEEMIRSFIRESIIRYGTTGKCFFVHWFCTSSVSLDLNDCNLTGVEAFPEYFSKLNRIQFLDLSKNPFSALPPGINGLSMLKSLNLEHCTSLRCLEAELLPSSLEFVYVNYCTSLVSFLDPLKPCHLQCSSVFCLDCTELVKRQDGKMTALASLSRFLEDPNKRRYPDFKFVVPQSDNELPSWFINQSSTASITIKLDPTRRKSELIGLAMVFCFRANPYTKDRFSCNIRGRCSKNWKTLSTTMELGVIESRISDHLFLMYSNCLDTHECAQLEPPDCDSDTLEFSFLRAYDEHYSSCGPCGVRLVYEEDIQELKQITSKYAGSTSS